MGALENLLSGIGAIISGFINSILALVEGTFNILSEIIFGVITLITSILSGFVKLGYNLIHFVYCESYGVAVEFAETDDDDANVQQIWPS